MKRALPVLGGLLLLAIVTSWLRSLIYLRTSGPIAQQVYVWQRQWTPGVSDAVANIDPALAPPVLLIGEMHWPSQSAGTPEMLEVAIDEKSIAGKPYAVAIRLGGGDPARLKPYAVDLVSGRIARLHERPTELHIDFDCPESKLDGYRELAAEIRKAVAPLPVTITALPSWLDRSAFKRLAGDGPYILQVHSLHRPKTFDGEWRIIDPAEARQAVIQAARIGSPFRVALPTYGHAIVARVDDPSKFAVLSEDFGTIAPSRFTVHFVRADPVEMAALVRDWTARRPAAMTGIIWYRMPVATDQLNWRPATLAAVMAGRTPTANIVVSTKSEKGLFDVSLANTGDADAPLPAQIMLDWTGPAPIASDVVGGYQKLDPSATSVTLSRGSVDEGDPANRLAPGDHRAIGWLRFATDTEVRGHVTKTIP